MTQRLSVAALLLAASLFPAGCRGRDGSEAIPAVVAAMSAPKPRVRVVKPRRETPSGVRVFPGVLSPWQRARLGARLAGELRSIAIDRGDHVKWGQLLATIGIPGLAQDVQRATAQRKAAEAELSLLEDQRRRTAKVVESGPKGVIADGEIAALDAKVEVAKARIASAAADQGRGGAMLGDTRLVAPFDGIVVARYADAGSALSAGSIVVEVADVSKLRLTVDVPERDAAAVRLEQTASVTIAALANRTVAAKVARFAPALDEATRTLRVEIDVPNPDGSFLAGVAARAAIDLGSRHEVLVLPADAVVQEGGEAAVLVVDGETARRRKVTVGYDRGPVVEITEGLTGDEDCIVGGRGLLRDGTVCEVTR